jgi:hypothetical protein
MGKRTLFIENDSPLDTEAIETPKSKKLHTANTDGTPSVTAGEGYSNVYSNQDSNITANRTDDDVEEAANKSKKYATQTMEDANKEAQKIKVDAKKEAQRIKEYAKKEAQKIKEDAKKEAQKIKEDAKEEVQRIKDAAKEVVQTSTEGGSKLETLYVSQSKPVYVGRGQKMSPDNMKQLHELMKEYLHISYPENPILFCGNGIAGDMVTIPMNVGFPISPLSFGVTIAEALSTYEHSSSVDAKMSIVNKAKTTKKGGKTDFDSEDDKALLLLYWIASGSDKLSAEGAEKMKDTIGRALDVFACKRNFNVDTFYNRYRRGERQDIAKQMKKCWTDVQVALESSHPSLDADDNIESALDSDSDSP